MGEPVSHVRAISAESVNNYPTNPALVQPIEFEIVVNKAPPKFLFDLNKPPPPDSSNDDNELLLMADEGGSAAPEIPEKTIPKGEVKESNSIWTNKRKKIFKWLSATSKVFKKKKE